MKISKRERVVIAAGIILSVLVFWFRGGQNRGFASNRQSSISESLDRINEYAATRESATQMSRELKLTIPDGSIGEQEITLRQELAKFVQQYGLKLNNIRRSESALRRGAGSKPIQFRIDLAGQFDGVMKLIYALEHSSTPFMVDDITINTASSSGGQQGPSGPSPSQPPPSSLPSPAAAPSASVGGPSMPSPTGMQAPAMSGPALGSPSMAMGMPGGITMPPGMPPGISPEKIQEMMASRRASRSEGMPPSMGSSGSRMGGGPSGSGSSPGGSSPAPAPSGGGGQPGQVQCTLLVQGHLFPVEQEKTILLANKESTTSKSLSLMTTSTLTSTSRNRDQRSSTSSGRKD